MKIETLKKDNKKKIAIGVIAVISIISTIILASSFAKYKLTESIPLANGEINYTVPDLNVLAMYQENEAGEYEKTDTIPESGYTFSSESYCATIKNDEFTKDESITINYDMSNKTINIVPLTKKTRCYLYFDKKSNAGDTILGDITINEEIPDFSKTSCSNSCNETTVGVYKAKDDDGTSYYYRGDVVNNYLKFANKWWRIIRINGDGTVRIIYDGDSYHANGTSTSDSIAVVNQCFSKNCKYNDNTYVGFMYGTTGGSDYNVTHANTNKSNVMEQLETWYANNLAAYENRIDRNAGFCGDRTRSTSNTSMNNSGGIGGTPTYYGANIRLYSNKTPTLECTNNNDLYTVKGATRGNKAMEKPIGLITADEVSMAGGVYGTSNSKYYLYNDQHYWTLSPAYYYDYAHVFIVSPIGYFHSGWVNNTTGVRPVINLRADVKITGSGTQNDPFVVN